MNEFFEDVRLKLSLFDSKIKWSRSGVLAGEKMTGGNKTSTFGNNAQQDLTFTFEALKMNIGLFLVLLLTTRLVFYLPCSSTAIFFLSIANATCPYRIMCASMKIQLLYDYRQCSLWKCTYLLLSE